MCWAVVKHLLSLSLLLLLLLISCYYYRYLVTIIIIIILLFLLISYHIVAYSYARIVCRGKIEERRCANLPASRHTTTSPLLTIGESTVVRRARTRQEIKFHSYTITHYSQSIRTERCTYMRVCVYMLTTCLCVFFILCVRARASLASIRKNEATDAGEMK